MWERETQKMDNHLIRMAPKHVYSYIKHDARTKLNVPLAKVMQQEAVLAEWESRSNPDTGRPPRAAAATHACHAFLTAVHMVFDHGLLTNSKKPYK